MATWQQFFKFLTHEISVYIDLCNQILSIKIPRWLSALLEVCILLSAF